MKLLFKGKQAKKHLSKEDVVPASQRHLIKKKLSVADQLLGELDVKDELKIDKLTDTGSNPYDHAAAMARFGGNKRHPQDFKF